MKIYWLAVKIINEYLPVMTKFWQIAEIKIVAGQLQK